MSYRLLFMLMSFSTHTLATEDRMAEVRQLMDMGQYPVAESLLESMEQPWSAEAHYYMALINDPIYHSIAIEPGEPAYQKELDRKAQKHYRLAIKQGHCYARYHYYIYTQALHPLRQQMHNVRDVFRNNTKDCLAERVDQNDPHATFMLGYLMAIDTTEPTQQAMPLVEKLIEMGRQGDRHAQYYLGQVFTTRYFGHSQLNDDVQGFAWFSVAAYQQHFQAKYHAFYLFNNRLKTDEAQAQATQLAEKYIIKYGQKKQP